MRFDDYWSVSFLLKCRLTCLRVTLRPIAINYRNTFTFCVTFDDFALWIMDCLPYSLLCSLKFRF